MGENICNHVSEKGLLYRMYKELQFNNKKTAQLNWAKDLNNISPGNTNEISVQTH